MDGVAQLPAADRADLFRETAARKSLEDVIPEKDFWVCWALHRLYSMPDIPKLLFKGGTSLSKCFGLIERFSEDIDLSLDRAALGFGGDNDPAKPGTRSRYKKDRKKLAKAAQEYTQTVLVPRVNEDFGEILGSGFALRFDSPETIFLEYPKALAAGATGKEGSSNQSCASNSAPGRTTIR